MIPLLFVASTLSQEFTTQPPPRIQAGPGENANLNCAVRDLEASQYVAWYRGGITQLTQNDTVTGDSSKYKINVELRADDNSSVYNLTILNLTETDAGAYGCFIETSSDIVQMSDSAQLNVVSFPSSDFPVCTPTDSFVRERDSVMIVCETELGSPAVDMAWLKSGQNRALDGTSMVSGDRKYLRYTTAVLSRENNRDVYTCRITSIINFPGRMQSCTFGPIDVQYPPDDIAISQSDYIDSFGDSFTTFRCSATGNPGADFSWSFSSPMSNSSYNITENGLLLVILDTIICEFDDIIATCEASNNLGTYTVNTTICKVPTCTPSDTPFNRTEGDSLNLSCMIDGIVDSVRWQQTNLTSNMMSELTSNNDTSKLGYEFEVNRYDLKSMYTCSVINTVPPWEGSCQSGPLNDVYFPPDDVVIVPTTKMINGSSYESYWCTASANPTDVAYAWSIAPPLDESLYQIIEDGQLLVVTGNITCGMSDIHAMCNASNVIGTHEADITLCRVPTCIPSDDVTFTEGHQNQTFTCQHNVSLVDIYWQQNDVTVSSSTQASEELDFTFLPDRNDTGSMYRCTIISDSQPSYEGACLSGPLSVQYPPEEIAIAPNDKNTSFYCSAVGVPNVAYSWNFNTSFTESSHYSLQDGGQRVSLLDMTACESDVIAVCTASNLLGSINDTITIPCDGQLITPTPSQQTQSTPSTSAEPSQQTPVLATPLPLNRMWMIIIGLGAFMAIVIILWLTICAAQHSPLTTVEVKDRKDSVENPHVTPTKYKPSLTLSEESMDFGKIDHSNLPAKLSLAPSETDDVHSMETMRLTTRLPDVQETEAEAEENKKNGDLEGHDNPAFQSFHGGGNNNPDKGPTMDLLTYMKTRPDSMDMDHHAMTNEHVPETTIPNGHPEIPNGSVAANSAMIPNGFVEESNMSDEAPMPNGHVIEMGEAVNGHLSDDNMPAAETDYINLPEQSIEEDTSMEGTTATPKEDDIPIIPPPSDYHDTPPQDTPPYDTPPHDMLEPVTSLQDHDDIFADVLNDIDGMLKNQESNGVQRKDSDVMEL